MKIQLLLKKSKITALSTFLLIQAHNTQAAELSGKVVEWGDPEKGIRNVSIRVEIDGTVTRSNPTDETGNYLIENLTKNTSIKIHYSNLEYIGYPTPFTHHITEDIQRAEDVLLIPYNASPDYFVGIAKSKSDSSDPIHQKHLKAQSEMLAKLPLKTSIKAVFAETLLAEGVAFPESVNNDFENYLAIGSLDAAKVESELEQYALPRSTDFSDLNELKQLLANQKSKKIADEFIKSLPQSHGDRLEQVIHLSNLTLMANEFNIQQHPPLQGEQSL